MTEADMLARRTGEPGTVRRMLLWNAMFLAVMAVVTSGILFALSRSSAPVLLGRYSPALFALVLVHFALAGAIVIGILASPSRMEAGALRLFGRIAGAGILAELVILAVPPVLLLFFAFGGRFTPLAGEGMVRVALVSLYFAAILGIVSAGGWPRTKILVFRGILTFLAFALVFVCAEVCLRILIPGSIFHPLLDLRPHVRLHLENRDLPGVSPNGYYSTNSWGMRGEEPPEDWDDWFTVVCIGGSTTQCFELDDLRTWPWLLQEHLREVEPMTWVGNGGLGGHGTRGHIVFMREVIPEIRPDMVLLLVGANELSSFMGFDPRERAALGTSEITTGYRLFCASRVIQVLYMWKKALIDDVPVQGTPWARAYTPVPLTTPERPLPDDLHELMFDPDFTRDNVRQIIAMAREYGVTPVFLTQPLLYDDTPYWRTISGEIDWERNPDEPFSAATTWRMIDTANRDVIEICAEEGVLCYDLASAIPHSQEYFYDMGHFSEAGAALVADSVAAFLIGSGLVAR